MRHASVGEIYRFSMNEAFSGSVFKSIILPIAAVYFGLIILFFLMIGATAFSLDFMSGFESGGSIFVGLLLFAVFSFLVTVIAVVRVHRLYLMQEPPTAGLISVVQSHYYWSYIKRAFLLSLIVIVPIVISTLLVVAAPLLGAAGVIASLIFMFYAIRWSFILPSAAIGNPMSFSESNHYFMGHKMPYFWAAVLIVLSFSILNFIWEFVITLLTVGGAVIGPLMINLGQGFLVIIQATAFGFALSYVFKIATEENVEPAADDFEMGRAQTPIAEPEPESAPEPEPEPSPEPEEDTADGDTANDNAPENDDEDPKIDQ